ncbi:cell division protein FtsQ/DivIB [Breoghania sp. L-A4]|nr:cell division protein FtsQ/DivIB [Breoghania sp. L-A4]
MPRWAGRAGAAGFLAATGLYGIVLGGHTLAVADTVTAAAGFSFEAIKLSGQRETDEFQILEALEIRDGSSLLLFDAQAARDRLARIAWVKNVSVQKFYPGTLQVTVEEREPFALWQRGQIISIIDADGRVITDDVDERYANLLLLVGHGAQERGKAMADMLDAMPSLRSRVRAAVLIADRRWNLVLENGITVRLPEEGVDAALSELVRLDDDSGLLSRDIVAVDLRLADRVVVRLTKDAALRRQTSGQPRHGADKNGKDT